jgi:hypothetical protein
MAASKIRIYKENGVVHIVTTAGSFPGITQSSKPVVQRFPTEGELTASVVDTNKIKIVDSKGNVIVTDQLPSQFLGKTGSGQIAATLAGVRDTLNGTGYFGSAKLETRIGSVESNVSTAQTDITALKNATKTSTGDRGLFVNDAKGTTSSHMAVTTTAAKLQAGGNTKVNLSETSPGTITLDVQAGSVGNETSVTAITVTGSSSLNNSITTFNQPVAFAANVTGLTTGAIPNLSASKITSGTFTTARIPSLNASKIGSGTLVDARVAASNVTQHQASLTITESQISDLAHYTDASVNTHLNQSSASTGQYLKWTGSDYAWGTVSSGGLGNVVEDTAPQLGGQLDANGQSIDMGTNTITDTKVGQWDTAYGWGDHSSEGYLTTLAFSALTGKPTTLAGYGITDALASLAGDTSPQLGGALDVDGNIITSNSNGDVTIDPAGTGAIVLKSDNIKFEGAGTVTMSSLKFYEASAAGGGNYVALKAPLSISSDVTWTLPGADGTSNQVIKTNGSGTLSFTTVVNTQNPLMQGTVSIQQVAGLSAKLKIFDDDTSHGVVLQAPDLTADVTFTLPATDGSSGQVLKTDGSGNLSFVAQTADTNTNIANTSLALNADRTVDSDGNTLTLDPNGGGVRILESGASTPYINCEQGALELNGINFPGSDGTSGQVLQTNGSGALSFATVSGGGGLSETPLVQVSGRFQWASNDSEERIHIGSNSYGPFNWYNWTSEPTDTNLRSYSAGTVDSTTAYVVDYHPVSYGIYVPGVSKKVKVRVSFRIQNGNANDFGFSLWDCPVPANGSTSNNTVTLRAQSATTTATTDTTKFYTQEFTTTSAVSDKYLFFLAEHRGDELNGTTYVYANISFSLVD